MSQIPAATGRGRKQVVLSVHQEVVGDAHLPPLLSSGYGGAVRYEEICGVLSLGRVQMATETADTGGRQTVRRYSRDYSGGRALAKGVQNELGARDARS